MLVDRATAASSSSHVDRLRASATRRYSARSRASDRCLGCTSRPSRGAKAWGGRVTLEMAEPSSPHPGERRRFRAEGVVTLRLEGLGSAPTRLRATGAGASRGAASSVGHGADRAAGVGWLDDRAACGAAGPALVGPERARDRRAAGASATRCRGERELAVSTARVWPPPGEGAVDGDARSLSPVFCCSRRSWCAASRRTPRPRQRLPPPRRARPPRAGRARARSGRRSRSCASRRRQRR